MSKYGEDVTITLTGMAINTELGSFSSNTSVNLTGQQMTVVQGFLSAQSLITLIEKSEFPSAKQIIVLKIIDELADNGILKAGEFISKIQDAFIDDAVSIDFIIDMIKSLLINTILKPDNIKHYL